MKQFIRFLSILLIATGSAWAATSTLSTSGSWSTAANWTPSGVPGSTADAVVNATKYTIVSTNVGSIKTLTLGNSSGEGAINMRANGVLKVLNGTGVSVVVGGPGVAGSISGSYPSYYSHEDGDFSTTGDMVIGTNALSGQAFFNQGKFSVGGGLKIGVQTSGGTDFKINGAGSGVSSFGVSRLEVGSRGKLTFDYLNGASVLPISVTNQITLSSGSTLVVTNASALQAGTYTLINGSSILGTFGSTNVSGFPAYMSAQVQYDTANGDVLLVVSNAITEFDNYTGDYFWTTQDNWYPTYPDSNSFGRLLNSMLVDTAVQIGYLETGSDTWNSAFNITTGGSLTALRPGVSLMIGAKNNGSSAPNYYNHADGDLTTTGDMVLGANGAVVEAQFSSGSIQVGGTLRLGSYQNSGSAVFELRGGGGTIGSHDLEVGDSGKLVFDYIGGASLKTLNVTGQASIVSGAKLVIKNSSSGPAPINPTTYTLIQASSIVGTFSQVEFSGFPSSVAPRIAYSAGQVQLVVESNSGGAVVDSGTSRLSGYSRVAPLGVAGYSFGSAADGEDVYYSDFSAGTITRVSGGSSTTLISGLNGIYGLAVKGTKMYFGREYDSNLGTAKIFEMTKSGSTWGTPRQVLAGLTRPRQIFIESSGTLLLAVETGQILRINPTNGASTTLVSGLYAPQAAVSDASGNLYYNEYGSTTADGTPTITGKLWKLPAASTNKTMLLEGRRLRGLALVPGSPGQLVQLTEANNGDQGNSSTISILTTTGTLLRTIEGVDYPQFTGVTASGNVVTTCPRDEALMSILPGNTAGSDTAFALRNGVDCFASVRGAAYQASGDGRYPVTITGMAGGSLTFYVSPDSNKKYAGWVRMTKSQWPNISTNELVSRPGYYALPQPGVQCTGSLDRLQIFPHRSRNISRWPMTNVGTPQEAPQPGFSEAPDAYLAYIEISQLNPTVSWDGGGGGSSPYWSTAANWSGDVLPGPSDNVLVNAGVYVTTLVGPVGNVVVGNADANGALNMVSPGGLTAASLKIGSANNSGGGTGYPNYFRGDGGSITTTGDFVIGANGAKIDGSYTWGDINVGGALKIGSGYTNTNSTLLLRGASGAINAGSLAVGGGVQLVFDYIGGTTMRTLNVTNGVTLEAGSSLKIVGNSNLVAGNNPRLINGGAGQLTGTFTTVTFEGFPANVVPRIEYNTTDGDVWLVISARTLSWDAGGGADQKWSTVTNWAGDVLPGSGDDVLLNGGVQVTTAVGPVGNVVAGNASGNGALNMISPGSLSATSLTIGAANNTGGGTGYPNYFYGNGGNITTTGDFVIGANGAKIDGNYTWGDITVGGALKIGAGYSDPGGSTLLLRGASSTISSGSLTIGGGVKLIMEFINGNSMMRTLTSIGAVTLESGSSIKIVGNSSIVAGNNRRLIDGGSLSGTFSNVTFEGFPSNVVPSLVYNTTDGDVWLVISARTISWDGGGAANTAWSTVANWSGDVLPGSGDDVLVNGGVQVTTAVGPVGNVVVGNASGNGSLNMIAPGSLSATSLTIGAANNTGGGTGYANYFYGNGGNITTTGDFVIGASGAKIDGTYTWGDITVGGALKIGAGYSDPGGSTLLLRGASSTITSGSLTIGGGVKLVMDFAGGRSMRTLTSTGAVTLESGSSIKIVGNSTIVAGDNPRLIDGAPGQLVGAFSNVTFEGFSSSVVPTLVYNSTDGDVWLVLTSAGTTFASWSGSSNAATSTTLMSYAVGGAASPTAASEKIVTTLDTSNLSITSIVRVDDTKLSVVGQSATSLSGPWTDLPQNPKGTAVSNQTGVSSGCERRIFSVSRGSNPSNPKMFLRLVVTLSN